MGLFHLRPLMVAVCAVACVSADPAFEAAARQGPVVSATIQTIDDQLRTGRFVEAERSARQTIAAIEARGQGDSLDMANALDRLIEALAGSQNNLFNAIDQARRALALKERLLGPEDPELSRTLVNLAQVEDQRTRFGDALSHAQRAVTLAQRAWPVDDPRVNWALTWVAFEHYRADDYVHAESEFHTAIAAEERTLDPNDPRLGRAYHGLGLLLGVMGRREEARIALERGLHIREAAYGPESTAVAQSANGLGNVLTQLGDSIGALAALDRTLAIREKTLGPRNRFVGQTLSIRGQLLEDLGDYEAARLSLVRALAIFADAPPHDNERAIATFRYARVFTRLGRYDDARATFAEAIPMMEAAFGPQNPFVAQALFNYAELLESTGQPADAVPLAERALDILRNRAPDHPNVAASLWQIARLREELGDLTSPRQLYEDMLQISERAQVGNPASMEFGRADYARYLARVGDDALAFDHAIRAERASRDLVRHVLRALPERQAALFAASHRVALDASLAVLAHSRQVVPAETAAAFDAVVRSRAIVLDEMAARRRAAASTPAVTRLQHDLNETRSRLARIVVRGQDEMAAPAYAAQVREALAAKERAEQTLAGASAAFRAERQDAATGFADVRAALPPASALVSYVQYEASTQRGVAETRFGAFVLRQGDDAPAFVALGLAKEIDAVASAARDQIVREAEAPGVSPLRAEQRYREAASALRRLVWDPIASAVAGRARIFIVADGALHLVNFSALPVGVDRYLIDRGLSLHYLSAERDLVSRPESHVNHGLLALGNPAFGRASVNQSTGHPPARPSVASDRGAGAACSGLEGMRFDPLPGSAAEASAVASLWRTLGSHDEAFGSVLPLRLATASKAAFKLHAPGQRVLHLATHGFAIPERCARSGSDALSTVVQENPLLLSGLALAGANRRHAESGDEDGILTAEEIAALDLEGVEWAVLSACGTGLGTVRAGEGVFGLRRAFRIAGAATVIMSLWPIDDQATLRWMDDLYRHRFVARLSTMDSIRQTSLDALRQRRTARASTHPYYWAGFVAVGEWR